MICTYLENNLQVTNAYIKIILTQRTNCVLSKRFLVYYSGFAQVIPRIVNGDVSRMRTDNLLDHAKFLIQSEQVRWKYFILLIIWKIKGCTIKIVGFSPNGCQFTHDCVGHQQQEKTVPSFRFSKDVFTVPEPNKWHGDKFLITMLFDIMTFPHVD
jgi:hypothetical protein